MSARLENLRAFVAVVDANGFGIAAERLGLAKSAISRRVRDLEDELGVPLLNRTTRRLSLTDVGAEFHARCVRVLADLQEAVDIASHGGAVPTGLLRVTAPVSFGSHCLAPALGDFLDAHPRLTLEVEMSDRMVDIVGEGFDVAVRISRLRDSSLIARRMAPIRHVACASPAYLRRHGEPTTPAALVGHRGIAYSNVDDGTYWRFRDPATDRPIIADVGSPLRLNNGDAIREAAVAGFGVAVLPTFIAHKAVVAGELKPILTGWARPPLELHALFPTGRHMPAKVRAFIDFIAGRFGPVPYWDRDVLGPSVTG